MCNSELAAELLLATTLEKGFRKKANLALYTYNRSFYDLTIFFFQTVERCLQIDLPLITEGYERQDISNVMSVDGKDIPPNDLKNGERQRSVLTEFVASSRINILPQRWVCRDNLELLTSG